jgi:hypothetical protein
VRGLGLSEVRRTFPSLSSGVRHLLQLLMDPKSLMEYYFTRGLLSVLFLWLVITFCNVFKSHRRSSDRSSVSVLSQEPLKSEETCTAANTVWSIDHCDFRSSVSGIRSKLGRVYSSSRLAIMVLIAICGLLLLGNLPLTSSLQSGLQSMVGFSYLTPSSTDLQDFFQLYQPISLASSGNDNCNVEMLLMDYVFGASYGAPFVGKRSRKLFRLVV